ncbi:MAG: alkaline shock response membrane anchor protein AmaP [Candidatus Omnitrophica bacterium]|nr:alkaline shock response membrane anchor protein AmaP [Candidatus Omnitrophota bacterium]
MRFLTVVGISFYMIMLILIGLSMIVFSFNVLAPVDIIRLLEITQYNTNYRILLGLSGGLLIIISYSFAQLILGRFQREKTIAFATSAGEVTISLSAIEDLIRQLSFVFPEIRELKPDVIATKKGIIVHMRVVLRTEANLPELTSRLQEVTKTRIQEVLGIEEAIVIKIHIAKIITKEEKDKRRNQVEQQIPPVPYGGYTTFNK